MKFTNEQAVEALRAELTNKGRKTLHLSEDTLKRQTEILVRLVANEEMGLPDFVTLAVESLNVYEGDARKKDSIHAKKEMEWEAQTKQNPDDPESPKSTENPEMKALMERIAALEKDKAEADAKSVLAQKKRDLTAKLKEKGVKDEKWLDKYLSKVNLTAETDIDAEVEDTLSLYNLNKANEGSSVHPANPNAGAQETSRFSNAIKKAAELAKANKSVGIVSTD